MLRRIYLTAARDRLMAEGKLRPRSRAENILNKVILGGAAVLSDEDRALYDFKIIPLIEHAALH